MFLPLVICLNLLSAAHAQNAAGAVIIEHGEYVSRRDLGPISPDANPDGVSQVIEIDDVQFVNHLDRVEAHLCRRFGIRYVAHGPALPVQGSIRVSHPHLVRPDGVSGDVDSWDVQLGAGSGFAGFSFDELWEVAPGPWSFAVVVDGQVLAEQKFDVVREPVEGAAPLTGCGTPIS